MKTTIRTIICAAAAMLAAVSCQKSIDTAGRIDEGNENNGTIDICVNGLMPEYTTSEVTKSELVNTVRVSWSGGESVYVFDGTQCLGSLVASLDGTENRYAKLSTDGIHTVKEPVAGTTKLTLVHSPLLTAAPTVTDGKISISLAAQNSAKAPFVVFATLDYASTNIKNTVVPFQFATSVVKVNCTGLGANTAIDQACLSNVNTVCRLELKADAAPDVRGEGNSDEKGTITRTNDSYFAADKVNAEGEAVFQIAVPVLDETTWKRTLIVKQGANAFEDWNFSKNGISAAFSVNTVCQLGKQKQTSYPDNSIHGKFSISELGFQICFAKGNLKYTQGPQSWTVENGTWGFFDHQYDCDPFTDQKYDKYYVSLFNWGYYSRFSFVPHMEYYHNSHQYYPGHKFADNEDWGCKIGDGKTWRTLTKDEWVYLLNLDGNSGRKDQKRFALCKFDGYCGLLIFPDGWDFWKPAYGEEPTYNGLDFEKCGSKSYTQDQIISMGNDGVVFLPGAGARHGTNVADRGIGIYWTSTCGPTTDNGTVFWAELLLFKEKENDSSKPAIVHGIGFRKDGFSVRLAADLAWDFLE